SMKVTAVETVLVEEFPNLTWVQVRTDEGLVGLGETFFGAPAVAAQVHDFIAPYLIGKDPLQIERHHAKLVPYAGRGGSGVEMRAASAVDVALWDIFGQAIGQPIYQALGGASRDDVRVYNTCAGYQYVRKAPAQVTDNYGLNPQNSPGPYEDLEAFLNDAGELAESLLEMGISGMKIWPFDFAAEASGGAYISNEELKTALEPFEKIRDAVGDRMEIMAELHSMWNVPMAVRICDALEDFDLTWIEDPVHMDDLDKIGEVVAAATSPIAVGELLGGKAQFRDLLEQGVSLAIMDIVWGGGLTEARKVAALADTWGVPFTGHDCTGPVALTASVHMTMHAPNVFIQEMVRAFYYGWYQDLVTQLPPVAAGRITAPAGPGLGTQLNPDVAKRADTHVRTTTAADL
ncbi:MAG: mandelate racemase/muconate lactonizing enzyme family protein, partial [Rhodospirillaceae bacterium]